MIRIYFNSILFSNLVLLIRVVNDKNEGDKGKGLSSKKN